MVSFNESMLTLERPSLIEIVALSFIVWKKVSTKGNASMMLDALVAGTIYKSLIIYKSLTSLLNMLDKIRL